MAIIDSPRVTINGLTLTEQTVVPATPSSGKQVLYVSASGINTINSGGSIVNFDPANGWNLAGETWTYYSADAPTYVFGASNASTKYSSGMKVKYIQSTGSLAVTKYAIITDVTGSLVTAYHGTDYVMSGCAIINPQYSMVKSPFGFPLDPAKWTVETIDTSDQTQSNPVNGTWYNPGGINIVVPIGSWNVSYRCDTYAQKSGATANHKITLSTTNNGQTDTLFSEFTGEAAGGVFNHYLSRVLTLTSKTTYYINVSATTAGLTSLGFGNSSFCPLSIRAVCAYL